MFPMLERATPPIPETIRRDLERQLAQLEVHFEANWSHWVEALKGVDPRIMVQLRAAFRAGYEAGR